MFKRELKRPLKPMPEYQIFAPGFLHALLAATSMILCLACVGVLVSYLIEAYYEARTTGLIHLVLIGMLAISFTHLNFMVSRGSVFCNALLVKFNRVCIFVLIIGNIVTLIAGDYFTAVIAAVGLALGLLAHQIYVSEKYLKFVEYYEIIWAHHRWNRRHIK